MYHSPDTNASVSGSEGVKKNSEVVSATIKSVVEISVLNCANPHTFLNDKTSSFFGGTGETRQISLHHLKEEKIVSAFTKATSKHKKSPLNLFSFKDLVSPESLRNAWVQLKNKSDMNIRGIASGVLNSIENV